MPLNLRAVISRRQITVIYCICKGQPNSWCLSRQVHKVCENTVLFIFIGITTYWDKHLPRKSNLGEKSIKHQTEIQSNYYRATAI